MIIFVNKVTFCQAKAFKNMDVNPCAHDISLYL